MGEVTHMRILIMPTTDKGTYQVQVDGSPLYEIPNLQTLVHILTQAGITGMEIGIAITTQEPVAAQPIDLDKLRKLLKPYESKTPPSGFPKVPKV
jgi:hypothetical protein